MTKVAEARGIGRRAQVIPAQTGTQMEGGS
jgi:hypothetical protein